MLKNSGVSDPAFPVTKYVEIVAHGINCFNNEYLAFPYYSALSLKKRQGELQIRIRDPSIKVIVYFP